jgi:hypothetical protein
MDGPAGRSEEEGEQSPCHTRHNFELFRTRQSYAAQHPPEFLYVIVLRAVHAFHRQMTPKRYRWRHAGFTGYTP